MKLPQATVKAKNFRHRDAFSLEKSNFSASISGNGFLPETGGFYKFNERKDLFVRWRYIRISEKMPFIQKNGFHEEKAETEIPALTTLQCLVGQA